MLKTDQATPGKQLIGLMGGTFDPIHHAHLIIAEEVRATLKLDEILFIPAGDPPQTRPHSNLPVPVANNMYLKR